MAKQVAGSQVPKPTFKSVTECYMLLNGLQGVYRICASFEGIIGCCDVGSVSPDQSTRLPYIPGFYLYYAITFAFPDQTFPPSYQTIHRLPYHITSYYGTPCNW